LPEAAGRGCSCGGWRAAWALYPGDVACAWHAALDAGVVADGRGFAPIEAERAA